MTYRLLLGLAHYFAGRMSMEKVFRVETTLNDDLAQLYAALMEVFDEKSSIPLADMNRALLQTGMLHHLAMMVGLGLVGSDEAERVTGLVTRVARDTIMRDVVEMALQYWRNCAPGRTDAGGTSP